MKNALKYLKLWQKKRSELRINDDPQGDWLQMEGHLDEHMPVAGSSDNPPRSLGFKLLTSLFISVSAAAMIFVGAHYVKTKNHKPKPHTHYGKHKGTLGNDSLQTDSMANRQGDSMVNAAGNKPDSLGEAKQAAIKQEPDKVKQSGGKELSANSPEKSKLTADLPDPIKRSSVSVSNNAQKSGLAGNDRGITKSNSSGQIRNNPLVNSDGSRRSFDLQSAGGIPGQYSRPGIDNHDLALNNINPAYPFLPHLQAPKLTIDQNMNDGGFSRITPATVQNKIIPDHGVNQKADKKQKGLTSRSRVSNPRSRTPGPLNLDWGLMIGANSNGSFTPKNQNADSYMGLPADIFIGPYVTYNLNKKFDVNLQLRLLSPQSIKATYSHANGSSIDTSDHTLFVTDSRKIYSIEMPLYIEYKVAKNLRLKAGPVFSIPVRNVNGIARITPNTIQQDSAYYSDLVNELHNTTYQRKLNYGLSVGANIHVNRWSLEATYLKRMTKQTVISDLGTYQYSSNTFQFGIGFQLNKPKH